MAVLQLLDPLGLVIKNKIGTLEIDMFDNYRVNLSNTVTSAPIETGESITDHVYEEPLTISGRAKVSNIGLNRLVENIVASNFRDPKLYAYETLVNLRKAREPIDVVLGLDTYTNMLITSITLDENASTQSHLEFDISLQQAVIKDNIFSQDEGGKINEGRKQGTIVQNSTTAIVQKRLINRIRGTVA